MKSAGSPIRASNIAATGCATPGIGSARRTPTVFCKCPAAARVRRETSAGTLRTIPVQPVRTDLATRKPSERCGLPLRPGLASHHQRLEPPSGSYRLPWRPRRASWSTCLAKQSRIFSVGEQGVRAGLALAVSAVLLTVNTAGATIAGSILAVIGLADSFVGISVAYWSVC